MDTAASKPGQRRHPLARSVLLFTDQINIRGNEATAVLDLPAKARENSGVFRPRATRTGARRMGRWLSHQPSAPPSGG